jgi:hypothetical protein
MKVEHKHGSVEDEVRRLVRVVDEHVNAAGQFLHSIGVADLKCTYSVDEAGDRFVSVISAGETEVARYEIVVSDCDPVMVIVSGGMDPDGLAALGFKDAAALVVSRREKVAQA